ncbi:MAG TPA: MFS transporter [Thermoplasmata archaeon]
MGLERAKGSRWFYSYLPQGIAGGATSALIPLFAYALGGGLSVVGIIAAATSIASVPAFMLWGSLSDHLGRRKIFLLIGFTGNTVCFVFMAASRSLSEFYLANLLIGALGAASAPVGTVLIMETTARPEWPSQLAFVSRIGAAGWVAGLGLGVVWLAFGPALVGSGLDVMRTLFLIGAAFGAISVLLAFLWTQEPTKHVDRKEVQGTYARPRVERGRYFPMWVLHYFDVRAPRPPDARLPPSLRTYLICVFLFFGGFTAFYSFFPIFLTQVYSLSNPEVFAVYIGSQAMSIAAYPYVGKWISSRKGASMQIYAVVGRSVLFGSFFAVGFVPMPSAGLFALIFLLHSGVGLCWAIINVAGSTLVSHLAPAKGRAQAFGAYNAVQGFGSILGPLLGGFTAEWLGYGPAIAVSVGLILSGSALLAALSLGDGEAFLEKGK